MVSLALFLFLLDLLSTGEDSLVLGGPIHPLDSLPGGEENDFVLTIVGQHPH